MLIIPRLQYSTSNLNLDIFQVSFCNLKLIITDREKPKVFAVSPLSKRQETKALIVSLELPEALAP
jgi:hypothetical protein